MPVPREHTSAPYGTVWVRCRRLGIDGTETSEWFPGVLFPQSPITASEIEAEGGQTWGETWGTVTGGISDTIVQAKQQLTWWGPWAFYAALALGAAYVWRSVKR